MTNHIKILIDAVLWFRSKIDYTKLSEVEKQFYNSYIDNISYFEDLYEMENEF